MLKHADPEATIVELELAADLALARDDDASEQAFHWGDDLDEFALIKHELRELRREVTQTRESVEQTLRLVRRRDRFHSALRAYRKRPTRESTTARAILRLMVAVFTLGGTIAGVGVALTVIHFLGDDGFTTVAAALFGLAVALGAWLAASLAALVLETADSVRDLP